MLTVHGGVDGLRRGIRCNSENLPAHVRADVSYTPSNILKQRPYRADITVELPNKRIQI